MDDFMTAKTRLLELATHNGTNKPVYETVSKRYDGIRKIYKARVTIDGLVDATGEGYSRRLAECFAAINAINEIKEVREEQRKSKEEQIANEELKNDITGSNEKINDEHQSKDSTGKPSVVNGINGDTVDNSSAINESEDNKPENGVHNSSNNSSNNSITISVDINTRAQEEEETEDNQSVVNGDDQSQSSSKSSNSSHKTNGDENGINSPKVNANNTKNVFLNSSSAPFRTFQPIPKNPVKVIHDFCVGRQAPYPFYDTTYKNRTFLIKCRIEFTEEEEKREFFGTGTGYTSKEAKHIAAEDIMKQLTELGLL